MSNPEEMLQFFMNNKIQYDKENPNFYDFKGKISNVNGYANLDHNNLILRGSILENTNYIYGCVLYVGNRTKIMLQQSVK